MSIFKIFRRTQPKESVEERAEGGGEPQQDTIENKSSHDLLVESVRKFRSDFRSVEEKLKKEQEEAVAGAKEKIAAAEKLVSETGLDHALVKLLEEMWHWPSWSKRDDFEKHKHLDATEVSGETEETEKEEIKRIRFKYAGTAYLFEFIEDKGYFEGTKWGRINLYSNDERLVSLRVYHDLDRHSEYDQWSKLSVDGLSPGSWIVHVVEMESKIGLSRDQWMADMERERLLEQAKGLPDAEQ